MQLQEKLIYKGECYKLLLSEEDRIFIPSQLAFDRFWSNLQENDVHTTFIVDGYKLWLQSIMVPFQNNYPVICNVEPLRVKLEDNGKEYLEYQGLFESVSYTGGIIISKDIIWPYTEKELSPCYCYKKVIELIFVEGTLVTTIDHSKAMVRIRMNIEKGLRDRNNFRDARCIRRFIRKSFVCHYVQSSRGTKWKQLGYHWKRIMGLNKI